MGPARRIALLVSGLVAGASCVDAPSTDELVAQRIVATEFDPAINYASFTTFAIVDSISVVENFDAGAGATVDPAVAGPILAEVTGQLVARGYRQVDRSQSPDLGVNVEAILQIRTASVLSYGGWWGSGPANPSFWGISNGAPFATFGYETVAWRSGTLVTELYDLRDARPELTPSAVAPDAGPGAGPRVEVVWGMLVHGVVGTSAGPVITAPPLDDIAQGFAQSPYLTREAPHP